MKVKDVMKQKVIEINPTEPVSVAARTLTQYNIGILPVCRENGRLCGVITDRDLVTRCVAAERNPDTTPVKTVMTGQVISVSPETELSSAATLMEMKQVKRLPVVEKGRVCGIMSLSDMKDVKENNVEVTDVIEGIWANVTDAN